MNSLIETQAIPPLRLLRVRERARSEVIRLRANLQAAQLVVNDLVGTEVTSALSQLVRQCEDAQCCLGDGGPLPGEAGVNYPHPALRLADAAAQAKEAGEDCRCSNSGCWCGLLYEAGQFGQAAQDQLERAQVETYRWEEARDEQEEDERVAHVRVELGTRRPKANP